MTPPSIEVTVKYFALLREKRGQAQETLTTQAGTAGELYAELKDRFAFPLQRESLMVAVNDEFESWETRLHSGDQIVFIPPVAGG